jgi:hypothetical protein
MTMAFIFTGIITSELYAHCKGREYRIHLPMTEVSRDSSGLWKGLALTFMSLGFVGSVCVVGIVTGPIDIFDTNPVELLMSTYTTVSHGTMLWLVCIALIMLCISIMWFVWRLHGSGSLCCCCGCSGREGSGSKSSCLNCCRNRGEEMPYVDEEKESYHNADPVSSQYAPNAKPKMLSSPPMSVFDDPPPRYNTSVE